MQAPPPPNGPVAPNPDVVAAPYVNFVLIVAGIVTFVLLSVYGYYRLRAVLTDIADRDRTSSRGGRSLPNP